MPKSTQIGPNGDGVYIIDEDGGPLKIGRSKDARKRRNQLQNSHSRKLTLEFFVDCGDRAAEVERRVLEILKPWHVRGEWFRVSVELAKIAIAAALNNCERRAAFLKRMAALDIPRNTRPLKETIALGEKIERDFPDLWPQSKPAPTLSPREIAVRKIMRERGWLKGAE